MEITFSKRVSVEEVEEGLKLQPKFDDKGLIPVITIDKDDGRVLMHGYMNEEALKLSISLKTAHYWSRSRKKSGKKAKLLVFIKRLNPFKLTTIKIV